MTASEWAALTDAARADTVYAARYAARLTQAAAAARIGATRRTWQEWEAGRRRMPWAKFELFILRTK